MFIITKKVPRRKLTAALFLFLLTLGLFGAGLDLSKDIQAASATLHTLPDPTGIRTNAERIAYLEGYGWITGGEPAAVEEILLPQTFGPDYKDYLNLQSEQGFDLQAYGGKTVKRYTYSIKNYPGLQENIWATSRKSRYLHRCWHFCRKGNRLPGSGPSQLRSWRTGHANRLQ